ncbi:hypothetical protein H5410_037979 [Solanum commersonii]|uniref:Uncharacterized protein n=1 Tax=Solanum commersonii TaxID=4109 RepID=A0A9J5Y7R5_SOLCO|nr:hypothetical protein H5410_037979 [Solanum commersonii]
MKGANTLLRRCPKPKIPCLKLRKDQAPLKANMRFVDGSLLSSSPKRNKMKIGVEDLKHIFIDVDNEEDYNTINSKNFINPSEDNNMKIQK